MPKHSRSEDDASSSSSPDKTGNKKGKAATGHPHDNFDGALDSVKDVSDLRSLGTLPVQQLKNLPASLALSLARKGTDLTAVVSGDELFTKTAADTTGFWKTAYDGAAHELGRKALIELLEHSGYYVNGKKVDPRIFAQTEFDRFNVPLLRSGSLEEMVKVTFPVFSKLVGGRMVLDLSFLKDKDKFAVRNGSPYGSVLSTDTNYGDLQVDGQSINNSKSLRQRFTNDYAVHIIVGEHAVKTHLAMSQQLCMKYCFNGEPSSPIEKEFLRGLLSRTNTVSRNETALIYCSGNLVERASRFTNQGLRNYCEHQYNDFSEDMETTLAETMEGGSDSWRSLCQRVFALCETFASKVTGDEEKQSDFAIGLFFLTFYHQFIGDGMASYVANGTLLLDGIRNKKGKVRTDVGLNHQTFVSSTLTRTWNFDSEVARDTPCSALWRDFKDNLDTLTSEAGAFNISFEDTYCAVSF